MDEKKRCSMKKCPYCDSKKIMKIGGVAENFTSIYDTMPIRVIISFDYKCWNCEEFFCIVIEGELKVNKMKKLILSLVIALMGLSVFGQNFKPQNQSIRIDHTNPQIFLNGTNPYFRTRTDTMETKAAVRAYVVSLLDSLGYFYKQTADTSLNMNAEDIIGIGNLNTTGTRVNQAFIETLTLTNALDGQVNIDNVVIGSDDIIYLDSIDIGSKSDTVLLYSFTAGNYNPVDTVNFSTDAIYGSFYNARDTIAVTRFNAVLGHGEGTDTLALSLQWHATLKSAEATKLTTDSIEVTSITTGDELTTFDNNRIPPGVRVWLSSPRVVTGNKPNYLEASLIGYRISQPIPSTYSAEYQAVYDAMTNKPTSEIAEHQDAMVMALVAGGYWARMDLFYCMAQYSNAAGEAQINWPNPGTYDLTDPGSTSPTFNSLEGFTGDGESMYLSTGFNPSTDTTAASRLSMSIGVYTRSSVYATKYAMGVRADDLVAYRITLCPRSASGTQLFWVSAASQTSLSVPSSLGTHLVTRRGVNDVQGYRNGISTGISTVDAYPVPNYNIYLLAQNNKDTADAFYTGQISFAWLMDGASTDDALAIHNIIETYMDAIGKGVVD